MASNFTRPTLVELVDRAWTDIRASVTGLAEWFRRSVEYGIARALAGMSHGLHGHASWLVDQAFVQFAEEAALLRRGDERGVGRNGAEVAAGFVTVTGAGAADILNGTLFQRAHDGWTYEAETDYLSVTTPYTIRVRAAEGFEGIAGNLSEGETLSFVSPVPEFDSTITVTDGLGGLIGGADIEDLEDYRERLHDNIRTPVLGGAPGDHKRWALEVSGVKKAWEYRGTNGVGNPAFGRVGITFIIDAEDIIPDGSMVESVRQYVQSKSTAEVIVFAPTPVAFDFTCSVVPNTLAVRTAVEAEVFEMVQRETEPGKRLRLSSIDEAISIATGEESHELTVPAADIELEFGEILVPGVATFEDP